MSEAWTGHPSRSWCRLKRYHNPFAFCSSQGRVIVAYSEFLYMHVDQPPERWTSDSPIDPLKAAIFDVGKELGLEMEAK